MCNRFLTVESDADVGERASSREPYFTDIDMVFRKPEAAIGRNQ